jgi:hypothetical protein
MRTLLKRLNARMAERFGLVLMRTSALYPWQRRPAQTGPMDADSLPAGAADRLRPDHPELAALRERYARCDPAVTTPLLWTEARLPAADLLHFRGDNAYVWQTRRWDQNALAYALSYYAFKSGDSEHLLDPLTEDGLFGVHHFTVDGRTITRDLLDSAREIQFLIRHAGLGAQARSVLDVGAGYGRLSHRLHQAFGGAVASFATDAFPASTFLSDYYLGFRRASSARVVPLDEVDGLLAGQQIDIAVNVHSFSECTSEAVAWWSQRLARHAVRYLLLVPNERRECPGRCLANDGRDLEPILERFGYRATVREPRHPDPLVQLYGVEPSHLHLFERRGTAG